MFCSRRYGWRRSCGCHESAAGNEIEGLGLDIHIVAEAAQPMHGGLAPEPGHLALGVVAVSLLRRPDRQFAVNFAAEKLQRLLIAESVQSDGALAIFLVEKPGFFD